MREGSLEAPTRHALDWQNPWFWDEKALEKEMERVFEICHGCRRCFNLCDSFPRLFDLVDNSPSEVAGVRSEDFRSVVDACTLCDMDHAAGRTSFAARELGKTDRNGAVLAPVAPLVNWANDVENRLTRPVLE